ncbi:hypothetical protein LOTGIDRAFT_160341 [Lottia gigantea]|uniref:Uncharacterized protein n=1 Tax=Lottia gigantea TaxID=225164 RepID=V4C2P5_LOTGI|nr:hypothetical protein LOTGIDRAFT_160341 [Lottia gigantea]ESO95794.1 hypothetical protein LOTGIDRAFT_160341 [Lottia gigantea]
MDARHQNYVDTITTTKAPVGDAVTALNIPTVVIRIEQDFPEVISERSNGGKLVFTPTSKILTDKNNVDVLYTIQEQSNCMWSLPLVDSVFLLPIFSIINPLTLPLPVGTKPLKSVAGYYATTDVMNRL